MTIIARCGRRQLLRLHVYPSHLRSANVLRPVQSSLCKYFHNSNRVRAPLVGEDGKNIADVRDSTFWKEYNKSFQVPGQPFGFRESFSQSDLGQKVFISGFLGKRRDLADKLSFADIQSGREVLQVISVRDGSSASDEAHDTLKSIKSNSSVFITGLLQKKRPAKGEKPWEGEINERIPTNSCEIKLESIKCLNTFPDDIIVGDDTKFLPEARHLQIRFDGELEQRLVFRSKLSTFIRSQLEQFSFIEVETPILFKSTPEGAREFLVPTRRAGYSYALPQSPQQYKQVLMASGISRYYQFARCFRDEDLRADRQPEFTQIDLEMACGSGEVVMQRIEELVKSVYNEFGGRISGHITDSSLSSADGKSQEEPLECSASEQNHHQTQPFPRMSYAEAMTRYGSDKPDLRIKDLIHRIDEIVPSSLAGMLTSIQTPIIEACRFRLKGDPKTVQKFIVEFMDSPEAEQFSKNSDGPPGVFTIDSTKPLGGLQAFGFEGAKNLKSLLAQDSAVDADSALEDGDLLIIQARENLPHTGGSTALGRLRIALYKQAVAQGLLEPDRQHHYLWVTNFPLFTLNNGVDPGQGGTSGFSATHHPFTAPKTAEDVDLLLTDPLKVTADHYDLVVNGVELGGGSRRIHNAEMQKFVMRNILKMSEERLNDFSHLFEALRAGCPPHAGFAFGFDRLVAVLTGVDSVKDVIAFPKSSKGEDLMVNSPSLMTDSQQKTYHLKVTD